MIKINPKFVYDENGNRVGVILGVKEFEKCIDVLENFQDYQLIKQRSGKKEKHFPLSTVINETLARMKK